MLVAHTTIVFLRYIMICDSSRMSIDEKSFGDLFFEYGDEVKDMTLVQALVLLFRQIKIILEDQLFLADDYINRIMDKLMESLILFSEKIYLAKLTAKVELIYLSHLSNAKRITFEALPK